MKTNPDLSICFLLLYGMLACCTGFIGMLKRKAGLKFPMITVIAFQNLKKYYRLKHDSRRFKSDKK